MTWHHGSKHKCTSWRVDDDDNDKRTVVLRLIKNRSKGLISTLTPKIIHLTRYYSAYVLVNRNVKVTIIAVEACNVFEDDFRVFFFRQ